MRKSSRSPQPVVDVSTAAVRRDMTPSQRAQPREDRLPSPTRVLQSRTEQRSASENPHPSASRKVPYAVVVVAALVICQLVGFAVFNVDGQGGRGQRVRLTDSPTRASRYLSGGRAPVAPTPPSVPARAVAPARPLSPPMPARRRTIPKAAVGGASTEPAAVAAAVPKLSSREVARLRAWKKCPPIAKLFGMLGAALALALCGFGASRGIAESGQAVAFLGINAKQRITRGLLPVVMAELISIYGLITAVIITLAVNQMGRGYTLRAGALHFWSGICVGACGAASGYTIGEVGGAVNRAFAKEPRVFGAGILLLVFAEAIALYGLIAGLLMAGSASGDAAGECVEFV